MSLLPDSIADARGQALDACSQRLDELDWSVVLTWLIDRAPADALPLLAWQLHVEEYDSSPPPAEQRQLIRESIEVHRRRGTPWAIRRTLERAGYHPVTLIESPVEAHLYDGAFQFDGTILYDGATHLWATYSVRLGAQAQLTPAQEDDIRRRLALVAPARCHLLNIILYNLFYNGDHAYDGAQNYDGIAND